MNKHPMLSVKEAAQLMGCDERWVRERLNQGQLKGEKKNIGLKEKWFVYAGEVEAALERRKGLANLSTDYLASPVAPPNLENPKTNHEAIVVDAWTDEDDDNSDKREERLSWLQDQRQALVEMAEEMMRPLVAQLQEKDSQLENRDKALQAANYRLGYAEGQLKDQAEQIKMLPDFQARAEKAEQLKLEAEAAKARAAELEANLIQVEKAKQQEIERLKEEKEAQAKAIEELRAANEAKLAEKEAHAEAVQEQLAALSATVQQLQRPWWKKMFSAPES